VPNTRSHHATCAGNLVVYSDFTGLPLRASGTNGTGVTDLDWSRSGFIRLKNPAGTTICTIGVLHPAPGGVTRVRKNAGLPQIYGTQFTVSRDGFGPYLIDDPENLDRRRAAVGLEPFADYEARMRTL
jgi:hypothetical protein